MGHLHGLALLLQQPVDVACKGYPGKLHIRVIPSPWSPTTKHTRLSLALVLHPLIRQPTEAGVLRNQALPCAHESAQTETWRTAVRSELVHVLCLVAQLLQ